jgi:hypothetical protein
VKYNIRVQICKVRQESLLGDETHPTSEREPQHQITSLKITQRRTQIFINQISPKKNTFYN